MPYTLKKITHQTLGNFYKKYTQEKTFLQTSNYAKFRTTLGEKILLRGIFKNEKLIGTALIQRIPARRSTFLHIPHGPLIAYDKNKQKSGHLEDLEQTLKFFIKE